MYSRVKLLGHPVHVMLVSFPVAFYTSSFVSFVAYQATNDVFWYRVGYVANVAGVITAIAAAIPGFIDWATGIPGQSAAKKTGLIHLSLNVISLFMFALNVFLASNSYNNTNPDGGGAVFLTGLGFLTTLGAGYFGWTLVQNHHVGVELTRAQENLEPDTSHHGVVVSDHPHHPFTHA